MREWKPIETAPLDGTVVDVWCFWPETGRAARTPDAHYDVAESDWQLGQWRAGQYVHKPTVTHWMPVPAGP